jgi:signal transduction histidine kinase
MLGTVLSRFSKEQVERFRLEFPEQTPLVFVDYQQWCRLMYHLIENALSYGSGEKGIVIGAAVSGPNLRIWVQDSGAGIQKEEEKRIFEKFYRGKAAESVPGGTGLGLAVAQEIVNAHGGRIFHERPKEKGARFVIELPAQFSREV